MNLELANQQVLIVGGARGIGAAIARGFLREGARVESWDIAPETTDLLASWTESAATEATTRLPEDAAARLTARHVDITCESDVAAAWSAWQQSARKVDHLVYAAGAGSGHYGEPFWEVPVESWHRVWDINVLGAVRIAHRVAPQMAARRQGTILVIASVAAQIGSRTDPPYSAAKAAARNFAQCMARDLAEHLVRVNVICPGMVRTELNRQVWRAWHARQAEGQQLDYDPWAQEKIARVTPLGRWQSVDDVASAALFLASPHAANITGQTWNVDGGQVMH